MKINITDKEIKELLPLIEANPTLKNLYLKISTRLKIINKIKVPQAKKGERIAQIDKILNTPIITEKAKQANASYKKIAEEYRNIRIKEQTKSEKITKAVLKSMNIEYNFQKVFYNPDTFYIVDFYLPKLNIVIEVDGGYHLDPKQKAADSKREKILKRYNNIGYIGRIKNEETEDTTKLRRKLFAIINHNKKT